jgi:DNA-binding transcriptional ArsR family regulator
MSPGDARPAPTTLAPVFAALGDPTRLALLARLSDGEARSIVTLSAASDLTRQAVTKHLGVLARAGLVRNERRGRETRFELAPEPLQAARSYLDTVSSQWDQAFSRLRTHLGE